MFSRLIPAVFVISFFTAIMPVHAVDSTEKIEGLDYYELKDLVNDKTVDCRKEKDKSTCVNYFSAEGVLIQVGARLPHHSETRDPDRHSRP